MSSDALAFLVTAAMAFLGLLTYLYTVNRDKSKDSGDINARISVLETKVDLLWSDLQKDMAKGIRNA